MTEDEILELISTSLNIECWWEGRTLTVMFDDEGRSRFAKLRLAGVLDAPSAADLRGEPE